MENFHNKFSFIALMYCSVMKELQHFWPPYMHNLPLQYILNKLQCWKPFIACHFSAIDNLPNINYIEDKSWITCSIIKYCNHTVSIAFTIIFWVQMDIVQVIRSWMILMLILFVHLLFLKAQMYGIVLEKVKRWSTHSKIFRVKSVCSCFTI